jgi:ABC-type Fe3+-hydroxamate transport system substrate-binding protein
VVKPAPVRQKDFHDRRWPIWRSITEPVTVTRRLRRQERLGMARDALSRVRLVRGQDLYTLDAGALAALEPDLILTQDLCRVCALPAGHVAEALCYLGCAAEVASLDPRTLNDVLATILTVGERTGTQRQAEFLVAALRRRIAAVAERVAGRLRPTVAVIEWIDPPFTALDPGSGHRRLRPAGCRPPWSAVGPVQLGPDRCTLKS